ncbi:DENN/MADD domain containing 2D, isoform CRA_c, partial [Homo sapiens]
MEGQVVGRVFRLFQRRLLQLRAGPPQDNSGEALKEPERAQEHSLPNFAGGQHFFEYLLVVSLKKKRSEDDYEPIITYQFPKRENLLRGQQEEEERLLKAIPLFCFPDGNEWASLTEYPRETFSFVLTNVDGSRKIGYCRRLLVCAAQNCPFLSAVCSAPRLGLLKPELQNSGLIGSTGCRKSTAQDLLPC